MQRLSSLKDSELRYRRLFEAAQDGILILDAETGMIEDVNPYLMKLLGYTYDEFVKRKLWEVGAFKDIEASKAAFDALQDNEYIRYEDLPLKTKDGRLIQVEFVSNVFLAGDEKVIQCNIREISEHKRIVAALQANAKKYYDLINQSPDGYFIIELSGNILIVNNAMCKELEFSEEEFLAMSIWDIIPEQFLDQYKERLTRILRGESFKEAAEYMVRGKTGRQHYVEVLSAPRYDGGDIIGFQGIARDITARKRAEDALQASEAKFRVLVEHLPTVVYINAVGDTTSTLYVSPQIETLLGYTPQEWLADPKFWMKSIHPEDHQLVLTQAARTDQNNEPFEMEYRMIARDGRLVWVHDQVVLVKDLAGQPQYWQGIMLDITERKQAEMALYESEERFRNAFQYSAIGMALVSLEGKWLKVNSTLCSIIGYSEDELLVKTFQDITHPDDLKRDLNYLNQSLAGEIKSYTVEKRYFHKEGRIIWAQLAVALARDKMGVPLYFISQIKDITERKQAEEALHESEEKFRAWIENSLDVVTVVGLDGVIQYASPSYENVLGYKPEDMIGADTFDLLHPDDRDRIMEIFAQTIQKPENAVSAEFRYRHRDGSWRVFEGLGRTYLDKHGQMVGLINSRDITERKQADEKLRESEERYSSLFENMLNGFAYCQMIYDDKGSPQDFIYLQVNKAFETSTGLKDVIGKKVSEVIPGSRESEAELIKTYGRVSLSGIPEASEVHLESLQMWISISVYSPQKGYFVAVFDVITERKRAEEAARETQARFEGIVSMAVEAIISIDENQRVILFNPGAEQVFGYTLAEALGMSLDEFLPPAVTESHRQLVQNFGAIGDEVSRPMGHLREVQGRRKEGTFFPAEVNISKLIIKGNTIYTAIVRDITERKREQDALRRLATVVETSNDGIIGKTLDGIITSWNQTAEKMFGYRASEVIGRSILLLFPPERVDDLPSLLKSVEQETPLRNFETERLRKDGSRIYVSLTLSPVRDRAGELVGISTISRDITERKKAEQRMQRQLDHLTAFREIDKAIVGSMNLHSVLGTVLEHVITDLGVDAAVILLYEPHAQVLKYELGKGFRTTALQFTNLRVGEGYAGRAVLGGHTIHIPNLQTRTTDFLRSPIFYQEEFVSYFGIPLIAKGEVKGVLEIFHRSTLEPDEEKLNFMETMAKQVAIAIDNATLYKDIQRSNVELSMAYDATIEGWSHALDLRDKETEGHSQRVTEITVNLARSFGLSEAELVQVRWGALLHDIGKMGIPDGILLKPGALTEEEWVLMKKHPRFAYDLLSPIRYLKLALDIPYCHHEKWDGTGYPRGLIGEQIPLSARIFAVVDVWDALCSDRPYRAGWPEEKVREYIRALSGTHFDPQVVNVFMQLLN